MPCLRTGASLAPWGDGQAGPTIAEADRGASTRAQIIATLAFVACFYAWSLLGPLAPDLQEHVRLSELQLPVMVAGAAGGLGGLFPPW
jgi:nitrate/nitrite transporter NarK